MKQVQVLNHDFANTIVATRWGNIKYDHAGVGVVVCREQELDMVQKVQGQIVGYLDDVLDPNAEIVTKTETVVKFANQNVILGALVITETPNADQLVLKWLQLTTTEKLQTLASLRGEIDTMEQLLKEQIETGGAKMEGHPLASATTAEPAPAASPAPENVPQNVAAMQPPEPVAVDSSGHKKPAKDKPKK